MSILLGCVSLEASEGEDLEEAVAAAAAELRQAVRGDLTAAIRILCCFVSMELVIYLRG